MERIFLDWEQPLLRAAARWSIDRARRGREVDLSSQRHLLAGRRATRRYLELLVELCATERLRFDPPELLLPQLYCARQARSELQAVDDLELEFAWRAVLAAATPAQSAALSLRARERDWVATQLALLHRELHARAVDLAAGLARLGLPDAEWQRLQALAELTSEVERRLAGLGRALVESLELTDDGSALRLIGLLELPAQLERQLRRHPDAIALVHAPAALAERFDAFGRPLSAAWRTLEEALDLRVAADPPQLAAHALARLAELEECPRDRITLGLIDPQLEAPLRCELASAGFALHHAEGVAIEREPLWHALAALAELLREASHAALTQLLRSPLVDARLRELGDATAADPIALLDLFASEHLLYRLAAPWPPPHAPAELRALLEWLEELRAPLLAAPRRPADWIAAIRRAVEMLHGEQALDPAHPSGRRALRLLDALRERLELLQALPEPLQQPLPAHSLLDSLLAQLRRVDLAELPNAQDLEALGWLELAYDDAEHLLLLGAHEGRLPASTQGDPFLPDSARAQLGLLHDAEREARDLHLLARLLHARRSCTVFVARRDLAAAPLLPSRLLLRAPAAELPARLRALLAEPAPAASWRLALSPAERDAPSVQRPPALRPHAPRQIRVTEFRNWLESPYRHHLRQVEGLRPRDFAPRELDAAQIGSLLHEVLEQFAREAGELAQGEAIERWLLDRLDAIAEQRIAAWAHPAARVQSELIRGRLRAFARVQESWRAAGWRIHACELELREQCTVDGEPIELIGRIDRIDRNADGRLAILDIKSSQSAIDPRKAHGPDRQGAWSDLQLPLYRRLQLAAQPQLAAENIELGYFQLPADDDGAAIALASWSEAEHAAAWALAEQIVRALRRGDGLDAPQERQSDHADGLELICREQIFADED